MITDRFPRRVLAGLLRATLCACSSKPDVDAAAIGDPHYTHVALDVYLYHIAG